MFRRLHMRHSSVWMRTTLKHQNIIIQCERVWISFKLGEKRDDVCRVHGSTTNKSMVWLAEVGNFNETEMRENNLLFYWSARNEPIIFNLISAAAKRKTKMKRVSEWCGDIESEMNVCIMCAANAIYQLHACHVVNSAEPHWTSDRLGTPINGEIKNYFQLFCDCDLCLGMVRIKWTWFE